MAKRVSIYSKVNFKTLKNELFNTMKYLASEKVNDSMVDDIDWKITKKGGVSPQVVSSIEKKIETQISVIDNYSGVLKTIFEKEGLSEDVKLAIETLTAKLNEIENYYDERPIHEIQKRYVTKTFSNGKDVTFMVSSKEERIASRSKVMKAIFKLKPIITELENMKEEMVAKGGYEIPESILYEDD